MRPASSALLLALVLAVALGACAPRDNVSTDEATMVAWWVEDLAHDHERTAAELVTQDASDGLLRIARWAHGVEEDHPTIPRMIVHRRERWSALRALIADGLVGTDRSTGELVVTAKASKSIDYEIAVSLVNDENGERGSLDLTVLTLGHADHLAARRYRTATRDARVRLDAGSTAR